MKDLEQQTDVSREAIHFYLREGLLPEPERPKRNVAHYSQEHVVRIKLIKRLQEERFLPLGVIKDMLDRADMDLAANGGDLASFELSLLALLNGDVSEPDQPIAEVAARAGLSEAEIHELAARDVVVINTSEAGLTLDFRDSAVVEHWGRLLAMGFRGKAGYDAGYLQRFASAVRKLAVAEVDLFLGAFDITLTTESADLATRGIEASNEILSRMRTQALVRRLAEKVESDRR
jgi:DNA-binding transcriptional MerR regulator